MNFWVLSHLEFLRFVSWWFLSQLEFEIVSQKFFFITQIISLQLLCNNKCFVNATYFCCKLFVITIFFFNPGTLCLKNISLTQFFYYNFCCHDFVQQPFFLGQTNRQLNSLCCSGLLKKKLYLFLNQVWLIYAPNQNPWLTPCTPPHILRTIWFST